VVIRNRKSTESDYSDQTKKGNNDLHSTTQKTKQLKTKNKSKQIIMYLSNEVRLAIVVLGLGGIKGTLWAKQ
jgi:hypothetical protein